MMRVIIRAFKSGRVLWEEPRTFRESELDQQIGELGEQHAAAINAGDIGMIELEFPDEPEGERFFRIGVETEGMVNPIEISLARRKRNR